MSNFDNAHNVAPYTSGVTKAFTGQRLAKVLFKGEKAADGSIVNKRENVAVSLPVFSSEDIASQMNRLIPHVRTMLEGVQDKIVREQVLAGKMLINGDAVAMQACIEYLSEDATGERLTKDSIKAWFDSSVADTLALAFAEKLGISETPTAEENALVMKTVDEYSSKLQMLAGGKTSFSPQVAEKLEKALTIAAPTDDELAGKFLARLGKMKVAASVDMLGL